MADIRVTIDNVSLTVAAGTNIVDAARTAGIAIPVFCYHPRMKAVGMCRMCLVEVGTPKIDRDTREVILDADGNPEIMMMPKLQTACTTPMSDGMVVVTNSEAVIFAQRGILEFLLTSHPLDCPVCDKGGECPLQNLTMGWGPGTSRFDYDDKIHFEKPVPLGDLIYLDRERCILCGRCVRFQDEMADDPVLGFYQRGRAWHIISKSDPPFDSKFSGNTTDICPVGALTTADFRFRARAWELRPVPSICTLCPVGCNITLDMRYDDLMRVMPRENSAVNDIWICDKGRFAQRFITSDERLTTPLVRKGNDLVPATWEEAMEVIGDKIGTILRSSGGDALAGMASPRLPNEDLYLFQRLFRDVFGSNHLTHHVGLPGEPAPDSIGAYLGVGSGTNLMTLGAGTTLFVIGADPEEEAPVMMLRLRGIANRGGDLIVANARPTKLDRSATQTVSYRAGSEVSLVRALMSLIFESVGMRHITTTTTGMQELRGVLGKESIRRALQETGLSEKALRDTANLLIRAENIIIVYGADALACGPVLTHDLGSLLILMGKVGKPNNGLIAVLSGGNARGALDMGVCHTMASGYRALPTPGLEPREWWGAALERRIKGLYVMGLDPAATYPATHEPLAKLDFLVVQDMFLTETAKRAHVVLPAASFAERDGTYTNAERRVQRARKAREAPGQSLPDWMILQQVAQKLHAMGVAVPTSTKAPRRDRAAQKGATAPPPDQIDSLWDYLAVHEIAMEIAEKVPGYRGITHRALAATAATAGAWGRQTNEAIYYDGTNYKNTEGVGIQYPAPCEHDKAPLNVKPHPYESPSPDHRYPFILIAQPMLYDGDTLLSHSLLESHRARPMVHISGADAERLAIRNGDRIRVSSAAGAIELPAHIISTMVPGSVVIPANLPDAPIWTIQTLPRTRVTISKV